MPLGPTDFLWIGLLPCAIASLAMWLAARASLRATAAWSLSIGGAVFLGMATQYLRIGLPTALDKLFHPRVGLEWLPWLVLVAALIATLAAYAPRPWQRWILSFACLFAIAVPLRLLASNAADMSRWSVATKLGVLAGWSLLLAATWATLALGRRNGQPLVRSGLLLVTVCGIAVTLAASGSIVFGELAGIVAATLLGAAGSARVFGRMETGPSSAAGPLSVALVGLILLGHSYDLTTTNALLLLIAIAASSGFLPIPVRKEGNEDAARWSWLAIVLRVALTLIPLAIAVGSAISTAISTTASNAYG